MTDLRRVTELASLQLAPNPGPMTLDGTNSYVLRAEGQPGCVVVDPGPDDTAHLEALAAAGPQLILITHQHIDHTEGAPRLSALTGAPVRAVMPEHCHGGGSALRGGERIDAAGVAIEVVATPGHSADSVSFFLPGDAPQTGAASGDARGSVLTGDTVLGRGSTVIGIPDGTLKQYLDSLRTLATIGGGGRSVSPLGLPAHGPVLDDLSVVCEQYLEHRLRRLDEMRTALATLGLSAAQARSDEGMAAVMAAVYPDIEPGVVFAAAFAIKAQLEYLAGE